MMHAVGGGALVPSGEHRGQVRIMLPETDQRVASGYRLEGSLEFKGDQDSGLVGPGGVLDGLDHRVGSIGAAHTMS